MHEVSLIIATFLKKVNSPEFDTLTVLERVRQGTGRRLHCLPCIEGGGTLSQGHLQVSSESLIVNSGWHQLTLPRWRTLALDQRELLI